MAQPPQSAGQKATSLWPGKIRPLANDLDPLRPWADRAAVRGVFEKRLGPGHTDAAEAVAVHLGRIGRARNLGEYSPLDIAAIAFFMLQNVREGRDPVDYGPVIPVTGPERTVRRWSREYPEEKVLRLLQQDLDVAALVRGGRTPKAARRWLQLHPGQHAKDAPPPRKRRAA